METKRKSRCGLVAATHDVCPGGVRKPPCCHDCERASRCSAMCYNHPTKCRKYHTVFDDTKVGIDLDDAKKMLDMVQSGIKAKDVAVAFGITESAVDYRLRKLKRMEASE